MSDSRAIAELVDLLMVSQKELLGERSAKSPNRDDQVRWAWAVLVNGQSDQCQVCAVIYPNEPERRFSISLIYRGFNIWRLDYEIGVVKHNLELADHQYSGENGSRATLPSLAREPFLRDPRNHPRPTSVSRSP